MVLVPGTVVVVAASCESVSKKGVLLAIQDNYHTYVMMMMMCSWSMRISSTVPPLFVHRRHHS